MKFDVGNREWKIFHLYFYQRTEIPLPNYKFINIPVTTLPTSLCELSSNKLRSLHVVFLSAAIPTTVDFCDEPHAEGNCSSFKIRWYFNSDLDECLPFVYSGCEGNSNNFLNKEKCESVCKRKGKAALYFAVSSIIEPIEQN